MNFSEKKHNFYSFSVLLVITILLLGTSLTARSQRVDFSGTWKLNGEKTDFGKLSENSTPIQMTMEQINDSIIIERFSKNRQGETHSYLEKLPFDGKDVEIMINATKKISSAQWSTDGQTFKEVAKYFNSSAPIEFGEYRANEIWTLSDEGKTLTIMRVDQMKSGNYPKKMVYNKQ